MRSRVRNDLRCVRSSRGLRRALRLDGVRYIVVQSPGLAKRIRLVKQAPKALIAAVIAGAAATAMAPPLGIAGLTAALTFKGAVGISIIVMAVGIGLVSLVALYKGYDVIKSSEVALPDGTTLRGKLILKRRK